MVRPAPEQNSGGATAGEPKRPRRIPLNRERVLRAAVALADETGLDGVSMRRLAQHLGVVPMALYKHVADKEELLDGMVDLVVAEFTAPAADSGWRESVRQYVLSARQVVLRHPWARAAIETRTRRTPIVLAYMDAVTGLFLAGGFSADLTHHVMHALGNRIWGFSPELFDESGGDAGPPPDPQAQAAAIAEFGRHYPHILRIATVATGGDLSGVGQGCDEQFEFEFALDLLLDGAGRLHDRGWNSRAPKGSGSAR
ncbi:TetR/AcrR family transcriptional regulator [Nocardia sp. BMG111209]|uniref:TetR/AcrR family transcriptional regulator n=1 Tax=Nocardia sp. BMG111209 TaxID=1160137 RepID=UPI000365555F|nr:TetR/AcrR family transcriptional regulator C-terminal domain-containing protein [Nocardia sp. BMG111209]